MPQPQTRPAETGSGPAFIPVTPVSPISASPVASATPLAAKSFLARIECKRMLFHILAISLTGFLCQVITDPRWRGGILIFALALCALCEYARTRWTGGLARLVRKITVREQELNTRSATMDFLLGLALSFLLFREDILATAVYITAWCDPMARLIGVSIGQYRWPRSRKTIEGSVTCGVLASGIAALCLRPIPLSGMVTVGVVTMLVELMPQRVYRTRFGEFVTPADNFFIPLACGCALSLLLGAV